jgi:DNA-binding CsgD family transcriptional regulator
MAMPNPPVPSRELTARDREVLWLMSQGMTYSQVGRRLGMAEQGAKSAARRVMFKLGALSIAHAVALALLEGWIGRWQGCGTHAAYQRHRKLHHTADPACLMAKARHDRDYRAGIPAVLPAPAPGSAAAGQVYRSASGPKQVRVVAVTADGLRADVTDLATGRPSRVLTDSLHQTSHTKYGSPRRTGYVRIREE